MGDRAWHSPSPVKLVRPRQVSCQPCPRALEPLGLTFGQLPHPGIRLLTAHMMGCVGPWICKELPNALFYLSFPRAWVVGEVISSHLPRKKARWPGPRVLSVRWAAAPIGNTMVAVLRRQGLRGQGDD